MWRSLRNLPTSGLIGTTHRQIIAFAVCFIAATRAVLAQPTPQRPTLLVLPAHSGEGRAKLPSGLGEAVETLLVTHLKRSGHDVTRLPRASNTVCIPTDYVCLAKSAKVSGAYVLDTTVQLNPDGTGYFTFTLADSNNQNNLSNESIPVGTPNSGHSLTIEMERNPEILTQSMGRLLRRMFNPAAPQAVTALSSQDVPTSWTLSVDIVGSGDVTSNPEGIACPGKCSQIFAVNTAVSVLAKPRLPASVVRWTGVSCSNSEIADPMLCQLIVAKDARLSASFERSMGRKVVTGTLWGLSVVGLVAGSVLLSIDGQTCTVDSGAMCHYATKLPGGLSLGVGGALLIGGALTFWLPR